MTACRETYLAVIVANLEGLAHKLGEFLDGPVVKDVLIEVLDILVDFVEHHVHCLEIKKGEKPVNL